MRCFADDCIRPFLCVYVFIAPAIPIVTMSINHAPSCLATGSQFYGKTLTETLLRQNCPSSAVLPRCDSLIAREKKEDQIITLFHNSLFSSIRPRDLSRDVISKLESIPDLRRNVPKRSVTLGALS